MPKYYVLLDFLRYPVIEKIGFGDGVYSSMLNNPYFTNSNIPLVMLKQKNDNLRLASEAAKKGGKEGTMLMRKAEQEWDDVTRKIAQQVDQIADGDGTIILSAGFNLARQRTAPQRAEFSVKQGDKSGSVLLRHQAVEGATAYIWEYCEDPMPTDGSKWINGATTSQANAVIRGLKPLTRYWFRVATVTRQGTTDFSSPILLAVV